MLRIPRTASAAALTVALATATVGLAPAASAHHPSPTQTVLADGLLSPLRAAIAPDGTAFVSQNFKGEIDEVSPDGHTTAIYTDPDGNEVGGLSIAGHSLLFTVTKSDPTTGDNVDSWLKVLTPSGSVRTIADLHSYEVQANPDQRTTYGFRHIDPTCAAQWDTANNGPATYTGMIDSHPYATYPTWGGWTYVADAGGNDVLLVSPWGDVMTVATLPAIPHTITSTDASNLSLPSCFVGTTYWFEPVPTDVEMGRDGTLFVSSLPGGPEGTALGARGSIFAISTHTYGGFARTAFPRRAMGWHRHHHGGRFDTWMRPIVTGLAGPTGLAVSPWGSLYVAELFGNTIAKVSLSPWGAKVTDVISTPSPGEVEWSNGSLYYTSNVLSGTDGTSAPAGQLVRYGYPWGYGYGHRH